MQCVPTSPVVVRPNDVPEIFIRGILEIEDLGDCARFVLYADAAPSLFPGPVEHRVRAQIVMQIDDIPSAIRVAAVFVVRKLKQRAGRLPLIRLLC